MAVRPGRLDALVELGHLLLTTGRNEEAGTVLDRAEAIAPDNAAVLTAQGRRHGGAGRRELARAYFQRAETLDPGNAAAHDGDDALRAVSANRLEASYVFEDFDHGVPATDAGDVSLNLRAGEAVRLFATGQRQRKFAAIENRAGGGVEVTVRPNVRMRGGALFGRDTTVLPRADLFGSVAVDARRATWSAVSRFAHFGRADFRMAGAGVLVEASHGIECHVRYVRGVTRPAMGPSVGVNSGTVGLSAALTRRLRASGDYTRGIDHLELLTVDRLGPFHANTWSAGLEVRASRRFSLSLTYDDQEGRPDALHVRRAGVRLVQRF